MAALEAGELSISAGDQVMRQEAWDPEIRVPGSHLSGSAGGP